MQLTPHKMLTGHPMSVMSTRGSFKLPPLNKLKAELHSYVKCSNIIYQTLFTKKKGVTEGRAKKIEEEIGSTRQNK